MSVYALPMFSWRFLPIWRRNFLVWKKLAGASVLGNIAEPLITLVAFGYGLGSLLQTVNGIPYIQFLASGSICMSIMMAASFETLYSAFSRMHVQKTWEALLNAPLALDDVVLAEMLWAATKAMFSGFAIMLVILLLGIGWHPHTLLVLPLLFLIGTTFASLGLIINALARGYDFFYLLFHAGGDADDFCVGRVLPDRAAAGMVAADQRNAAADSRRRPDPPLDPGPMAGGAAQRHPGTVLLLCRRLLCSDDTDAAAIVEMTGVQTWTSPCS